MRSIRKKPQERKKKGELPQKKEGEEVGGADSAFGADLKVDKKNQRYLTEARTRETIKN